MLSQINFNFQSKLETIYIYIKINICTAGIATLSEQNSGYNVKLLPGDFVVMSVTFSIFIMCVWVLHLRAKKQLTEGAHETLLSRWFQCAVFKGKGLLFLFF